MKVGELLKNYSEITGKTYDTDSVRYVPNMLQNYCYLFLGCAKALVDIIPGEDDKLYFVWKKDDASIKKAFDRWCLRNWKD